MTRLEFLAQEIRRHSKLYTAGNPEISDVAFDALCEELKTLAHNVFSGTIQERIAALNVVYAVGASDFGNTVSHISFMGSLDKEIASGSIDNVIKWQANRSVVISWKMDGCSLELRYNEGKLEQAVTRGDGKTGQDVTRNARMIGDIPQQINYLRPLRIRGEVYMRKSVFDAVNVEQEANCMPKFANPRNAATGSLLQKNELVTRQRMLSFAAWDVLSDIEDFATETEKLNFISKFMPVVGHTSCFAFVDQHITSAQEERAHLNFAVDGLVLALDSIQAQKDEGMIGDCPRGKIAFKFPPPIVTSRVLAIEHQVGRTGKLTPMCRVEPVLVDGTTVSNITLHNDARVRELDIAPGDIVAIAKGGDIIPGIVRVTDRSKRIAPNKAPTFCPICDSVLEFDENCVSLWCRNTFACMAQRTEALLHFVSVLGVMEVGEGVITKLLTQYDASFAPHNFYTISEERLAEVIGSKKIAATIMHEFETHRAVSLDIFLAALGIPLLGIGTAEALAKRFHTLHAVLSATPEQLDEVEGIGALTATKIAARLAAAHDEIMMLCRYMHVQNAPEALVGTLTGKSFCLTGAMSRPRKAYEAEIKSKGGTVCDSVKQGLSYLVQADPSSNSSKSVAAKKYNVSIISETDLQAML